MWVLSAPEDSLHSCPEYGEEKTVSGKENVQGLARGSSMSEKQGVLLLWCWGQESPMGLFQQKAIQMRDGERLPTVEEPCCPAFPLPTMLLSQAVVCCASLSIRGLSIQWRREWVLPWVCGLLFWSHLSVWTCQWSSTISSPVCALLASSTCLFRHNPHWFPPSPERQPSSSLASKLLLHLCLPVSFKSLAQHLSTCFLRYSQGREGEEWGDINLCRSFLGITAVT